MAQRYILVSRTKQINYIVRGKEFQMTQLKKIGKQILKVLRDFLILIALANVLALFTIPGDEWSLQVFFRNCMFFHLIGLPNVEGN